MFTETELEPLKAYQLSVTEDDEMVIEIPGYYPGEPLVRKLFYPGYENAILVRNDHQKILCDSIYFDKREKLFNSSEVMISETDTGRRYKVAVEHEEINLVAERAYELHDYYFKYNPHPQMNGTFETGSGKCLCCGEEKKVFLFAKGDAPLGRDLVICPDCINNTEYLDNDLDLWPGLSEKCWNAKNWSEMLSHTPPFRHNGKLSGTWAMHCGMLSVYLGKIEPEDLAGNMWDEIEETWNNDMNAYRNTEPGKFWKRIDDEEVSAYLFRCPECGKHLCIFLEN